MVRDILIGLKIVHKAGYVYNDLKLDNIMLDQKQRQRKTVEENNDEQLRILLIDFGMATKYVDEDGDHLPNCEVEKFKGNLLFATLNTLQFNRPSRKDDLISLCYLLFTMLNGGDLPKKIKVELEQFKET